MDSTASWPVLQGPGPPSWAHAMTSSATNHHVAFPECRSCGGVPVAREEEACRFCGTVLTWADFDLRSRRRVVLEEARFEHVDAALRKVATSAGLHRSPRGEPQEEVEGPVIMPLAIAVGVIGALCSTWVYQQDELLGGLGYLLTWLVVNSVDEYSRTGGAAAAGGRKRGQPSWASAVCVLEVGPPETRLRLRPRRLRRITARLDRQRTREFTVAVNMDLHAGDVGVAYTRGAEITRFDLRMHLAEDLVGGAPGHGDGDGGEQGLVTAPGDARGGPDAVAGAPARALLPATAGDRDFPLCEGCGAAPASRGEEVCRFCGTELSWAEFDLRSKRRFAVDEARSGWPSRAKAALLRVEASPEFRSANRVREVHSDDPYESILMTLQGVPGLIIVSIGAVLSFLGYLHQGREPVGLLPGAWFMFLALMVARRAKGSRLRRDLPTSGVAIAVMTVTPNPPGAPTVTVRLAEDRTQEFSLEASDDLRPGDVGLAYTRGSRILRVQVTEHVPPE